MFIKNSWSVIHTAARAHFESQNLFQGNGLARNMRVVHEITNNCQPISSSFRPYACAVKGKILVAFNGGILAVGDGPLNIVIPVALSIGNGGEAGPEPDPESRATGPEVPVPEADSPVGPDVTETPKATIDAL